MFQLSRPCPGSLKEQTDSNSTGKAPYLGLGERPKAQNNPKPFLAMVEPSSLGRRRVGIGFLSVWGSEVEGLSLRFCSLPTGRRLVGEPETEVTTM